MPIPANPTLDDIVTEGLKRGGKVNPTAGEISTAKTIYTQEVKTDLHLKAPRHPVLLTQYAQGTTVGVSRYTIPAEAEYIRSIQLVDGSSDSHWAATAQGGGTNYITLHASFNQDAALLRGRFVFLVNGTGAGQFAQAIAYDNSTKQLTVEGNWSTLRSTWVTPNSTTGYVIETYRRKLWDFNKPWGWDTLRSPFQQGTPTWATIVGRQVWLDYAPDRSYCIFIEYWRDLTQLDETETLFTDHLRKFRSLWTQGIAVKVCQRYDEDRYQMELQVYNVMLDLYGAENCAVGLVTPFDA